VAIPESPRRPQSEILEEVDRFALTLESLPNAIVLVRADGKIALVNVELERQSGYTRQELIGCPVEVLFPAAAGHRGAEFLAAAATGAKDQAQDLFARRRDGSVFPVNIGCASVETTLGPGLLATILDITARREAEDAYNSQIVAQLEFERLVADLSTQFINLPADRVDEAIRDALRRIGEALDLDRCQFFRIEPDGQATSPTGWQRAGTPPAPSPVHARELAPWVFETLRSGGVMSFSSVDEIPNPKDRDTYRSLGVRSSVTVPLSVAGRLLGAVGFNMLREERRWSPELLHRLRVFATAFGNVLARREGDEALQKALDEVRRLRDLLHAENEYLRAEVRERISSGAIVGQSAALRRVLEQVEQVAQTDSTVLLLGETGTGKELFAAKVHELSARRGRSMVRVNCSAIPSTLMESELFGRERGAFTGALARQIGRFELADRSTIFLDEIGDLPPEIQVKLLRVLEERQIERLGSPKGILVDVRIIAATHRNLEKRIAEGTFREDLFYRLNVFPIQVPPLRERVDDIPLLIWRFVEEFSRSFGKRIDAIPRENIEALQAYAWPGNIRELRNVVERAMIVASGTRLTIAVPAPPAASSRRTEILTEVEKDHIRSVLESTGWRIRGSGGAADRLGLKPTTLETRMAKLGLVRPR
jgi:formate hydrogenlyase transcriptional activator